MQLNEAPEFSAMREALEEGGAIGNLGRYLGSFDNSDRRHRTKVFVLYVNRLAEEYEDQDFRVRKWFSVDEAHKLLGAFKPIQANYLVAMKQTRSSAEVTSKVEVTATAPTGTASPQTLLTSSTATAAASPTS